MSDRFTFYCKFSRKNDILIKTYSIFAVLIIQLGKKDLRIPKIKQE